MAVVIIAITIIISQMYCLYYSIYSENCFREPLREGEDHEAALGME